MQTNSADQEPQRGNNLAGLTRLLDAAFILTVLTGVVYFVGWLEAAEYFAYFGLTAEQAGLPRERILVAGFYTCFRQWIIPVAVLVAVALSYIAVTTAMDRWAWAREAVAWFAFGRFVGGLYAVAIAIMAVGVGLPLLGGVAVTTGKESAEKAAKGEGTRTIATYLRKDAKEEERKTLLWFGNGKYFLIDPPDKATPESRSTVTIVNDDRVEYMRLVKVMPEKAKD